MHGDVFGDNHLVQNLRVGILVLRAGAAAAAPREQGVDGDLDRVILDTEGAAGFGDHLRLGQGDLPGEDLHPLEHHRAEAGFFGGEGAHCVGQDGAVALLQGPAALGGLNGQVGGHALGVGQTHGGKAVALDGHSYALLGGGLPGGKGLDA